MTKIEDYLWNVEPGVDINIQKEWITEWTPGWKVRVFGLSKEGSRGQWYNGRYHIHDMGDYWSAHVDHADPDTDPIGHLVQDAPGVLALGLSLLAGVVILWAATRDESG